MFPVLLSFQELCLRIIALLRGRPASLVKPSALIGFQVDSCYFIGLRRYYASIWLGGGNRGIISFSTLFWGRLRRKYSYFPETPPQTPPHAPTPPVLISLPIYCYQLLILVSLLLLRFVFLFLAHLYFRSFSGGSFYFLIDN